MLNTSLPYYRNSSRESRTARDILPPEIIKSARLPSRDRYKKQNTSITDIRKKTNNSFYENRNSSFENQNALSSYIQHAFQEKKVNQQNEAKQKEVKYLLRIAALEKENQKLNEMVSKIKKENDRHARSQIQLNEVLQKCQQENSALKKHITQSEKSTSNTLPSYMVALSLVINN